MDRMSACEAVDPGSIPGEGTKLKQKKSGPTGRSFYFISQLLF